LKTPSDKIIFTGRLEDWKNWNNGILEYWNIGMMGKRERVTERKRGGMREGVGENGRRREREKERKGEKENGRRGEREKG